MPSIRRAILLLLILPALSLTAQSVSEKGTPPLRNYAPADYLDKGKIWDIGSAPGGMVYMAADKGLLEFDGTTWRCYQGSAGIIRSIRVIDDTLIYTGSDLDFGVWRRNAALELEYASLYPHQKEVSELNEEFWNVFLLKSRIAFVSSQNIYVYDGRQLTKIPAPAGFTGSCQWKDTLFLTDGSSGLYAFNGRSLTRRCTFPPGPPLMVAGVYHDGKNLVVVTRDQGLFRLEAGALRPLDSDLSLRLQQAKVFSFERINDTLLALGTVLKGVYLVHREGKLVHHINKHKGLPNNTVLSLHGSGSGKLWMGMDFGLSVLDLSSRFTFFFDHRGDFGTGYTALLNGDDFFLGTNQGLYHSPWEAMNDDHEFTAFSLISGTEGQVWSLAAIDGQMFVGHDRGLFMMQGRRIEWLMQTDGAWTMLEFRGNVLVGGYNGISVIRKEDNRWKYTGKLDLILGSCNQLLPGPDGALWVRIPTFGIIRAVLDHNLYPRERIIFPEADFEGDDPRLEVDAEGLHLVTSRYRYTYLGKQKRFTTGVRDTTAMQHLQPGASAFPGRWVQLSADYSFYPVYNGFALENLRRAQPMDAGNFRVLFRSMVAHRNHESMVFFPGDLIPFRLNNLEIACLVPNREGVLYQFRMDEDGAWSDWSPSGSLRLYDLDHGEHTIYIRSRIGSGMSEVLEIPIRIEAPWYRKGWAILSYVVLLLMMALLLVRARKRFRTRQQRLIMAREKEKMRLQQEEYRQKIIQLEQERLRIDHDQLKQQLKNKTIELASKAKDNEDKNRLLLTLKEKCETAQRNPLSSQRNWAEMQRLLDSFLKVEDRTFDIQMDELHQEFFRKLRDRYPALSGKDLRFCAYLKIGLNSKEIADILNIQPSSAFISRSRLRKKLSLRHDEDLYEFLNSI
ncbi:MAG TPA: hypothetical protein P5550_01815 [Bacteroidales bacterium]|nr:hypothetical protein [Bacteroidales bacterium]